MSIFPNPSNGIFEVIMPIGETNLRIEVYNSFGTLVLNQPLIAGQNLITINNHPNGVFVAKTIIGGKTLFTQNIIKQ